MDKDVKVDGFALNTCWAITGGKKLTQTERNELGEQQWGSVSSASFFLIKNDAVLVWQLSLEHCINSQTWINGFESSTVKKKFKNQPKKPPKPNKNPHSKQRISEWMDQIPKHFYRTCF